MPGMNALLGGGDLALQRQQLPRQPCQTCPCQWRDALIARLGDHRKELLHLRQPDPGDNPELRHVGADRIDHHGPLTSSRVRCTINTLCCSAVLTATKRIEGRVTASQIASASAASFLFRLT